MGNTFSDFLQSAGMYETIAITKEIHEEFLDVVFGNVRISEYCPVCKENRVFSIGKVIVNTYSNDGSLICVELGNTLRQRIQHNNRLGMPWTWNGQSDYLTRIMHFSCVCAMQRSHHLDYITLADGNILRKIGQYPTVADLSFPKLDEVSRVTDKDSLGELRRAIGLYAHGIGVGSYVYLRRIFERIINQAKDEAEKSGLSIPDFDRITMQDKIKALKNYLPDMISSNATIYSIVSKGIHELSEEDCKRYFPILRDSILLILKKWAQRRNEAEAEELLNKSINAINSELSK